MVVSGSDGASRLHLQARLGHEAPGNGEETGGGGEGERRLVHPLEPSRELATAVHGLPGPDPDETPGGPAELAVLAQLAVEAR
jgi:hypothetical protein